MPATHLALLRGINVGGKNKIAMTDLRSLFVEAGCRDVQTYIQSGNVIFTADATIVTPLADDISAQIAARFGYQVPVVMRTVDQVGDVLRHKPFLAEGAAEEALHVLFLAERPDADRVAALDADRSPPDRFAVRGQEVYLYLPNGAGRTRLTNAYFDAVLATTSTGRNWRTVTMLNALMNT
jgi:uncharacterized protein (DUF1697 family)